MLGKDELTGLIVDGHEFFNPLLRDQWSCLLLLGGQLPGSSLLSGLLHELVDILWLQSAEDAPEECPVRFLLVGQPFIGHMVLEPRELDRMLPHICKLELWDRWL